MSEITDLFARFVQARSPLTPADIGTVVVEQDANDEIGSMEEYLRLVAKISPRPTSWADVIGNKVAVDILLEAEAKAQREQRHFDHTLLFGPPGMGKTTLSRLVAKDMGGFFFETVASTLETPTDLLKYLVAMNRRRNENGGRPSVLFIDEIHRLGQGVGRQAIDPEQLYGLLEDWKFPHNVTKPFRPHGYEKQPSITLRGDTYLVWPMTIIGATTDPGMLPEPLLSRFPIKIQMEPYTEAEMTEIVLGSATRLGLSIQEPAAQDIARFSRSNPRRANELLTQASNRSTGEIRLEHTRAVIERLGLYPEGLTRTDVKILMVLADRGRRGAGQVELARAVGIALSQFSGMVEPYLRLLGYMETLSRRVITQAGLRYLAALNLVDSDRPDVRAAIANG